MATPNVTHITEALVREYLTAAGYTHTLDSFKKEVGTETSSIKSRRELAFHLGIRKAVETNKEKGSPLKSYLEILVENIAQRVSMIRSGKEAATANTKYIKASKSSKSEIPPKPQSIPNAFAATSASSSSNPIHSYKQEQQQFKPPAGERRSSIVDDIQVIEDLDLSDDEDAHFHQEISKPPTSILDRLDPIEFSQQQDQEISKILFPAGLKDFSPEWKGKGFVFQTISEIGYGLVQVKGGPCGLLASTQAVLLKTLLISRAALKDQCIRPTLDQAKTALIQSLGEIIWNAGVSVGRLVVKSPKQIISTRLTSEYCYLEYISKDSLLEGIRNHISQFYHSENRGNGLVQFLLSCIISRGPEQVKSDMDEWSEALIGKHSYCTQEMVNLVLYGKATSNLHDGVLDLGGQLLKGLDKECEIGQLSLFEHYDNLEIGNFGKCPRYPIFVVCSESHYTVLFGTMANTPIVANNVSKFDFFYYDGLSNQSHEIKLTLTLRGRKGPESRDLVPPIELCLTTKWGKDLLVDWNGTEPLL